MKQKDLDDVCRLQLRYYVHILCKVDWKVGTADVAAVVTAQ